MTAHTVFVMIFLFILIVSKWYLGSIWLTTMIMMIMVSFKTRKTWQIAGNLIHEQQMCSESLMDFLCLQHSDQEDDFQYRTEYRTCFCSLQSIKSLIRAHVLQLLCFSLSNTERWSWNHSLGFWTHKFKSNRRQWKWSLSWLSSLNS